MKYVIDDNYLVINFLFTLGMQFLFWQIANWFKFDKVTDIAGSMNFVALSWLTFLLSGSFYTRQIIAHVLLNIWGFRLGMFLLYRVLKRGKDERFDEIRESFWSFLGFWIGQLVWVFVVSLPIIFLQAAQVDSSWKATDYAGWCLFAIGFLCEIIADQSKYNFNADPSNRGKLLRTGLWAYSRHPNYFGEIIIWIGFFLMSCSVYEDNTNYGYFSLFSPILTFVLLMFASGIPPAEQRYDQKFGQEPSYIEYKRSTSVLIPFPPSIYRLLPSWIKLLFFFEFPMYSNKSQLLNNESQL